MISSRLSFALLFSLGVQMVLPIAAGVSSESTIWDNTKKACRSTYHTIVHQYPGITVASITLLIAIPLIYKTVQIGYERRALENTVPGIEELRDSLARECARHNKLVSTYRYSINWTDVYSFIISKKHPELAEQLLAIARQESNYGISASIVSCICLFSAAIGLCEWHIENDKELAEHPTVNFIQCH